MAAGWNSSYSAVQSPPNLSPPLSSPLSLCLVLPSEPSAASPCLTDALIHCVADEMVVCLLDAKVVCELLFIGVYSERLR